MVMKKKTKEWMTLLSLTTVFEKMLRLAMMKE